MSFPTPEPSDDRVSVHNGRLVANHDAPSTCDYFHSKRGDLIRDLGDTRTKSRLLRRDLTTRTDSPIRVVCRVHARVVAFTETALGEVNSYWSVRSCRRRSIPGRLRTHRSLQPDSSPDSLNEPDRALRIASHPTARGQAAGELAPSPTWAALADPAPLRAQGLPSTRLVPPALRRAEPGCLRRPSSRREWSHCVARSGGSGTLQREPCECR